MKELLNILNKKSNPGITLIELLLVISLIGILTAVLVNVIDPQSQRDKAEDGVRNANLAKACAGIEAYYQGENEVYPDEGAVNNPLVGLDGTLASIYISEWPEGFVYNSNLAGDAFSIHVMQVGKEGMYKCNSSWKNVQECAVTTDPGDINDCD